MNNVQRREGEDILGYAKRLIGGKKDGIYDIDYVEMYEMLFGIEISSTESRKRSYGINDFIGAIDSEKHRNVANTTLYDGIVEQQRELKKERVKLQTEKLEYNKWLRESARGEMFEEKIIEAISTCGKIEAPKLITTDKDNAKEGMLTIADVHFGREGIVYGHNGEIINEYNEDIFKQRMWLLLDEAVEIIKKEGLDKINLFILGDLLEGMNRISTLQSLQYGVTQATILVSEFMSVWIAELSKHAKVEVFNSKSNHCEIRMLNSKNGDFDEETFDHIIVHYLKARLLDNENVTIHDAKGLNYADILGVKVASVHGHNDRNLENSIKNYGLFYGERIDILLGAHFHSGASATIGANEFGNVEWIQSPSICGVDSYAKKLKKSAKAGSKFIVIEEGKGKTVTYDITLS